MIEFDFSYEDLEGVSIIQFNKGEGIVIPFTVTALNTLYERATEDEEKDSPPSFRLIEVIFATGKAIKIYSYDELVAFLDRVADIFTPTSFDASYCHLINQDDPENSDDIEKAQDEIFGFSRLIKVDMCNFETTVEDDGDKERVYYSTRWESVYFPNWPKFMTGMNAQKKRFDFGSSGPNHCVFQMDYTYINMYFLDRLDRDNFEVFRAFMEII